jgi:hypothetical protein
VHETIYPTVESNLTGFKNLSGLVVDFISCMFLNRPDRFLKPNPLLDGGSMLDGVCNPVQNVSCHIDGSRLKRDVWYCKQIVIGTLFALNFSGFSISLCW